MPKRNGHAAWNRHAENPELARGEKPGIEVSSSQFQRGDPNAKPGVANATAAEGIGCGFKCSSRWLGQSSENADIIGSRNQRAIGANGSEKLLAVDRRASRIRHHPGEIEVL